MDKIKAEAQEKGDLGLVAESSRSNQRMMFQPANLTAGGVFTKLKEIANMSGNSVSHRKTFSLEEEGLWKIMFSVSLLLSIGVVEGKKFNCVCVCVYWRRNYLCTVEGVR